MEDIFVSSRSMKEREKLLTTGCPKLDERLRGGIPCRGITQIYGTAGTGKTQLGLQLCLTVQLPVNEGGLAAGALYICTESVFPSRRLQELIHKLDLTRKHGINGDSVFVEHVLAVDELESCLLHKVPTLMAARKIGLVIVDSIAAPYRVEEWNDTSHSRGKSLRTVGEQLRKLSTNGDVCVICINQVAAVVHKSLLYDSFEEQPTLGITWSSMITTSIRFYRMGPLRYVVVKSSSNLPEINIPFEIHGCGVKAID